MANALGRRYLSFLSLGAARRMKRFRPVVIVSAAYALLSFCLLALPLNTWVALHVWYVFSWPTSHLFARERMVVQVLLGSIQYALLATVWVLMLRRRDDPDIK